VELWDRDEKVDVAVEHMVEVRRVAVDTAVDKYVVAVEIAAVDKSVAFVDIVAVELASVAVGIAERLDTDTLAVTLLRMIVYYKFVFQWKKVVWSSV
jgi:hypothetical protein